MQLQTEHLFPEFDLLQKVYGDPELNSIYGCGQICQPKLFFVFMNPTSRNVSASQTWKGIRAPWLGTKNIWKMFYKLNLISQKNFDLTQSLASVKWTTGFCEDIYEELAQNGVYVTNLGA